MDLNRAILDILEKNSRITPAELAVRLDADEADIVNAIAKMEDDGIICGYLSLINHEKLGDDKVTALIEVRVTPQKGDGFDSIAKKIYRYDEVQAVYLMSGGFDFTVIVEGKSMRDVAMFVSGKLAVLDQVLSTATHFVLRRYKDHGIEFEKRKEDERMRITP